MLPIDSLVSKDGVEAYWGRLHRIIKGSHTSTLIYINVLVNHVPKMMCKLICKKNANYNFENVLIYDILPLDKGYRLRNEGTRN